VIGRGRCGIFNGFIPRNRIPRTLSVFAVPQTRMNGVYIRSRGIIRSHDVLTYRPYRDRVLINNAINSSTLNPAGNQPIVLEYTHLSVKRPDAIQSE